MCWLSLLLLLFAPLHSQNQGDDQLYLSININDGERLELSNGSIYEIAPIDRIYSAYWITPFPIMLSDSSDPEYPTKITNMNTGTFVRGKQLIVSEVLKEEMQQRIQREQQEKKEFHPPEKESEEKPQATPETKPEALPDITPKPTAPQKKPTRKPSTTSAILKPNHIHF